MKTIILYNPNSTGPSKANALALAKQLRAADITVQVKETTHAGHAGELAQGYAKSKEEIALLSSSGDGGYHELINGALSVPNSKLIVGVIPSGNANDHYTALGSDDLAEAIIARRVSRIDTIKLTGTQKGRPFVKYAHSYIGIGVTAIAARRLTEERPGVMTEKWIVLHSLVSFRSVKIKENGKNHRYSSLIFSNIPFMSKVIKLAQQSSVTDGKFEVTPIRFRSKLRLLLYLVTAATVGLHHGISRKLYRFRTIRPLDVQIDGEVYKLDGNSVVSIEAQKQNLLCIL